MSVESHVPRSTSKPSNSRPNGPARYSRFEVGLSPPCGGRLETARLTALGVSARLGASAGKSSEWSYTDNSEGQRGSPESAESAPRLRRPRNIEVMAARHPRRKERPGVDRAGRTPLHYAAADGNLAEGRRLLAEGANPGAADDDGWTPLHFAAQGWHVELAELLLSAGAQVDAKDAHGNTPLGRRGPSVRVSGAGLPSRLLARARSSSPF